MKGLSTSLSGLDEIPIDIPHADTESYHTGLSHSEAKAELNQTDPRQRRIYKTDAGATISVIVAAASCHRLLLPQSGGEQYSESEAG